MDSWDSSLSSPQLWTDALSRRSFLKYAGTLLVGTSALVPLIEACSPSSTGSASGPIGVGIMGGFSGQIPYGQFLLKGASVAKMYIESEGGVLGRKLNLVTEDTQDDPVDAVTVARRMLATQDISVVLGLAGIDYQDVLPILDDGEMVTMQDISDPALDHTVFKYSFATSPSDALIGAAMAAYASTKGYGRIAVVFDTAGNSQTTVPAVLAGLKNLGASIVAQPTIPVGLPSYVAVIQQIKAANPDVILTQMDPKTAGVFYPELRAAGLGQVPQIGTDFTLNPDLVTAMGGAQVVGQTLVSVEGVSTASGPGAKVWVDGFSQLYGSTQYIALELKAYDGLNVAALAMVAANSTDPKVYVNHITEVTTPAQNHKVVYSFKDGVNLLKQGEKIKYSGVGSSMTYDQWHRVTSDFVVARLAADGTAQQVDTISADLVGKALGT